jgi:hypothetical protein
MLHSVVKRGWAISTERYEQESLNYFKSKQDCYTDIVFNIPHFFDHCVKAYIDDLKDLREININVAGLNMVTLSSFQLKFYGNEKNQIPLVPLVDSPFHNTKILVRFNGFKSDLVSLILNGKFFADRIDRDLYLQKSHESFCFQQYSQISQEIVAGQEELIIHPLETRAIKELVVIFQDQDTKQMPFEKCPFKTMKYYINDALYQTAFKPADWERDSKDGFYRLNFVNVDNFDIQSSTSPGKTETSPFVDSIHISFIDKHDAKIVFISLVVESESTQYLK